MNCHNLLIEHVEWVVIVALILVAICQADDALTTLHRRDKDCVRVVTQDFAEVYRNDRLMAAFNCMLRASAVDKQQMDFFLNCLSNEGM